MGHCLKINKAIKKHGQKDDSGSESSVVTPKKKSTLIKEHHGGKDDFRAKPKDHKRGRADDSGNLGIIATGQLKKNQDNQS